MSIKARYEDKVLKPLGNLDLDDSEIVEIEVKKSPVDRLGFLIKMPKKEWIDEVIENPDLDPV